MPVSSSDSVAIIGAERMTGIAGKRDFPHADSAQPPRYTAVLPAFERHPMHRLLALLALLICVPRAAAARLDLDLGHGVQRLTTQALLSRTDVRTIDIPDDVAYHRPMRYRAVPLGALLDGIHAGDHLQFVALDGFAAEIDAAVLLADHGARAWLAIEDPAAP